MRICFMFFVGLDAGHGQGIAGLDYKTGNVDRQSLLLQTTIGSDIWPIKYM